VLRLITPSLISPKSYRTNAGLLSGVYYTYNVHIFASNTVTQTHYCKGRHFLLVAMPLIAAKCTGHISLRNSKVCIYSLFKSYSHSDVQSERCFWWRPGSHLPQRASL